MARRFKEISVSPLFIICTLFVIITIGVMMIWSVNNDTRAMQVEYSELQAQSSDQTQTVRQLSAEVSILNTNDYIMTKAREMYGYMLPGELRFIIANPAALGEADQPVEMYVVESDAQ